MASWFTALSLGSGEAFVLQTAHKGQRWTILVDSGYPSALESHKLVAALLKVRPNIRRIDIAICTHQDDDHSGGFQNFADAWCTGNRTIGEYWLPGRWAAAVPEILFDPFALAQKVRDGAVEVAGYLLESREPGDPISSEKRIRDAAKIFDFLFPADKSEWRVSKQESKSEEEVERVDDSLSRLGRALGTTPDLLIALEIEMEESGLPPSEILRRIVRRSFRRLPPFWPTSVGGVAARLAISLFFEAMDTAESIVAIAESAVRWTIPIRWFDFGLFEEKVVRQEEIQVSWSLLRQLNCANRPGTSQT